ncbi:MAG: DHA2 family efflux MFS transporter permease subunit [Patescibacteria group bacterium]|nr:DHA2 family efflux MFS transporter permease subunit [Patescibacteria group bacterium]
MVGGAHVVDGRSTSRWLILFTVIIGTFLGRLDQTIVNLALPKIISDFSISVSAAGWIGTAYILANAIFVPIWGKLGDTIGRKKVYLAGFGIFIVGSVLAGLAWNLGSMLVFRVLQAIASSADYPTAMAIISVTFRSQRERAQALGIWSTAFGASAVLGPLIGGPLIDVFGWRSVFFLNLPIGLIGMFMAIEFIHESKMPEGKRRFDWWGATSLGAALGALVLVLDKGVDWGWFSGNALACYAVIFVASWIFYIIEKTHPEPIVDFKFFSNSVFVSTLLNNFIVFMALMGSVFLVPIFAQTYLGYNATQSGLVFIPMAFGLLVAAPLGGFLIGKVKPAPVIVLSTAGAAFGLWLFTFLDPRSSLLDLMIPLLVMAFFMGFGMAQRTNAIAAAVSDKEIGVASGVLALVRNIAGAFGIALFATILQAVTNQNVLDIARSSVLNVHTPEAVAEFTSLITLKAQIAAYGTIYRLAAFLMLAGAVLAFRIQPPARKFSEPVIAEA